MKLGTDSSGKVQALTALTPAQVRKAPIEQLGILLKTSLIKAEDGGANGLYVYVRIERDDDD
jgi:hypothetical protein